MVFQITPVRTFLTARVSHLIFATNFRASQISAAKHVAFVRTHLVSNDKRHNLLLCIIVIKWATIIFLLKYLSFLTCYLGDCSCSSYITKSGYGNCQKTHPEWIICYVNMPSTCSDLVSLDSQGPTPYSWEACGNTETMYKK